MNVTCLAVESEKRLESEICGVISRNVKKYFGFQGKAFLTKVDRDYWSVIFVYKVVSVDLGAESRLIFCKIPKFDWSVTTVDAVIKSDFDSSRKMARTEFANLQYLREGFERCGDLMPGVIRPLDYLSEYNAILTEGVDESTEIFELLRQCSETQRVGEESLSLLKKAGVWLGHIHILGRSGSVRFEIQPSVEEQLRELMVAATAQPERSLRRKISRYIDRLAEINVRAETSHDQAILIEGFEVRNFITANGKIFFLDPGAIRSAPLYEDLSRFVASIAILYWGTLKFIKAFKNETLFVRNFIDSYRERHREINEETLNYYLAKQYIKLWLEGLKVLRLKGLGKPIEFFAQKVYMERFFSARLDCLINMALDRRRFRR